MRCNVGNRESVFRIGMGAFTGMIALFFPLPWPVRFMVGALATGGLITGYLRYCPINQIAQLNNYRPEPGMFHIEALS